MSLYMPDRKVLAGGIAGLLVWGIALGVKKFGGIDIPPDILALLPSVIGTAMAYMVPPSQRDIIKRLNDQLVQMAAEDPTIPVTPK